MVPHWFTEKNFIKKTNHGPLARHHWQRGPRPAAGSGSRAGGAITSLSSKRKFGLRHSKEVVNSGARSELRTAGEIRKMRKKKEQYREHLKRKGSGSGPKKGSKRGNKGVTSSVKLSNKRKAKGNRDQ